ncbi:MAG: hypothetical protein WA990_01220 [Rubrobacteraceae bacterium]
MTPESDENEQLTLPFDQYQRHRIVADALDILGDGPLKVLEISAGDPVLRLLYGGEVKTLARTGISGNEPATLPFDDEAFDYVVGVDSRSSPKTRDEYLSELRRVARGGVLLNGPFESGAVRAARRFADELRQAAGTDGAQTGDAGDNDLPEMSRAREFFEERGDHVDFIPNGYLPHWIAMTSLRLYAGRAGREAQETAGKLDAFYNEFMYRHDNFEPSYNHLMVALKENRRLDLDQLYSSAGHPDAAASTAFFGAFSTMLALMARSESPGRSKDLERLLAQKEVQIRDLSRRLARQLERAGSVDALGEENANLSAERDRLQNQLDAVRGSRTWKIVEQQQKLRLFLKNRIPGGRR